MHADRGCDRSTGANARRRGQRQAGAAVIYFGLAGWLALIAQDRVVPGWSLFGLVGYGMLIELLRAQTGYRYAKWADVLANGCGCIAASLLFFTPLARLMRHIDGKLAS